MKKNNFLLKLKLKRHKLTYILSDDESKIQLGGAKIGTLYWLSMIIVPFVIGFTILVLTILGIIPFVKRITPLFIVIPFMGLATGITMIFRKKANNKNIKIIEKNKITVISNGVEKVFEKSKISKIDYKVDNKGDGMLNGTVYFIDSEGKENQIIGIWEEERKFLIDDLTFFADYFKTIIG